MGRRYRLPPTVCTALVELLGPTVLEVKIIEHSCYARLHYAAATTRPNRIYVAGSGDDFAADLPLVLHEYCHVLRQWATGRMTRSGYLFECLRRGYWNNRFEIEARDFAADGLPRLATLIALEEQRVAANNPPSPAEGGSAA
jgi:hypothetical protein